MWFFVCLFSRATYFFYCFVLRQRCIIYDYDYVTSLLPYIYCLSILTVLLWSGQQICLFNLPSLYLVLPLNDLFFLALTRLHCQQTNASQVASFLYHVHQLRVSLVQIFVKMHNEKVKFQKIECLVKTVKKCIMKKLSIWLALIKVTVWGINYQKGQYIYKGIYFILFFYVSLFHT